MKKISAILLILFAGAFADANILIDPYLGYAISGTYGNSTVTGTEMGGRLGWSSLGFAVGLDATIAGSYTYTASNVSISATPFHYGIFASFQFPILFRGYATYFLSTKETDSASNYYTGTGTKIGVQFTGLPFVAIGLEVFSNSIAKYTSAAGTVSATGTENQTRLTISAPFDL